MRFYFFVGLFANPFLFFILWYGCLCGFVWFCGACYLEMEMGIWDERLKKKLLEARSLGILLNLGVAPAISLWIQMCTMVLRTEHLSGLGQNKILIYLYFFTLYSLLINLLVNFHGLTLGFWSWQSLCNLCGSACGSKRLGCVLSWKKQDQIRSSTVCILCLSLWSIH